MAQRRPPGNPDWLVQAKVWLAQHRLPPVRAIRCWTGSHNPPHDELFELYGAVMIGGPCTRCSDETWREVAWPGNAWDLFPDQYEVTQLESGGVVYRQVGSIPPE
jgi:hypothetical protein